jgi:hypothetical protein
VVDRSQKIAFLKKIHLFHGMSDERLDRIADDLNELSFDSQEVLFERGSLADSFFLIYAGGVTVKRSDSGKEVILGKLFPGDYFGEEALLSGGKRSATIEVNEGTVLFALNKETFANLYKTVPNLRSTLRLVVRSRQLNRKLHFSWLEKDEVVYLLTSKHQILLYQNMIGPILAFLLPLMLTILYLATESIVMLTLAVLLLLADILWGVWNYIDWSNDYYIITNRRVVWVEKVIGLYDSRQEAPLIMVLPVAVATGQLGRILDFGDVIIRTYTSRIVFHYTPSPSQVAAMVEEYRGRAQAVVKEAEVDAMKGAIRRKLGLEKPAQPDELPPAPILNPKVKASLPRMLLTRLVQLRTEEGDTITYRRHWYVLFQQTWKPFMFIIIDLILMGINNFGYSGHSQVTYAIVLFTVFIILALWFIYELVDWRNDRFEVTSEQIVDLDKKPLGTEDRKSAKLEDILTVEYKRIGVSGVMFNYGTVYITVGTTVFTFDDVHDPAAVQQEIEQRRNARILGKHELEASQERERMAEWLATYHRSTKEFGSLDDFNEQNPE